MRYPALRSHIYSGDVVLVESRRILGVAIRVMTGQQMSHVGVFVRLNGGLWIADITGAGYRLQPASQRLPALAKRANIYWGKAPAIVRLCDKIVDQATRYRDDRPRYSHWTLISVWLSQLLHRSTPHRLVCSTMASEFWQACGFHPDRTPDPGDFVEWCDSVSRIDL